MGFSIVPFALPFFQERLPMHTSLSLATITCAIALTSSAHANLRITEAMSSSGTGGTPDWFEITNYGASTVDLTGWRMDDGSFNLAASVALGGVLSISAGQSLIFIESAAGAGVSSFAAFWGFSAAQIGFYSGTGVSLGSGGDGVGLFDSGGSLVTQVSFGAATTGSSFFYGYDALGAIDASYNGLISSTGSIGTQITAPSVNALANIGSLGSAIGTVPTPGAIALLGLAGLVTRRRR